jgi:hypothetical protein
MRPQSRGTALSMMFQDHLTVAVVAMGMGVRVQVNRVVQGILPAFAQPAQQRETLNVGNPTAAPLT